MIIQQAHKLALTQAIDDRHLASLYDQDPFPYLRFLYYASQFFAVKTAVELGTCTGRGTAHLAAACEWVFTIVSAFPLAAEIERFIPDGFKK